MKVLAVVTLLVDKFGYFVLAASPVESRQSHSPRLSNTHDTKMVCIALYKSGASFLTKMQIESERKSNSSDGRFGSWQHIRSKDNCK